MVDGIMESSSVHTEHDGRLEQLVDEYLEAEEAGRTLDRAELLSRYPVLRPELESFFAGQEQIRSLAGPLHALMGTAGPGATWQVSRSELPGIQSPPAIGKYRVLELLGVGGEGEVFRAFNPDLRREVVIKWARQTLPEALQQKLIDEGRMLARIDDPGVVRVHDVDVFEGRPFMVLEYLPGQSLAERLKEGPLSPRAAAVLVAEVAATLDRVHGQDVLHRDLKPGNILIDRGGRPRLLDFGLACLSQHWGQINPLDGKISGTFYYMAPEQANGQIERIGRRTDIFGLGAVLYHLLAGRPPYQVPDRVSLWRLAKEGKFDSPRKHKPGVPWLLERICLKAMAHEPEQRYASAVRWPGHSSVTCACPE